MTPFCPIFGSDIHGSLNSPTFITQLLKKKTFQKLYYTYVSNVFSTFNRKTRILFPESESVLEGGGKGRCKRP